MNQRRGQSSEGAEARMPAERERRGEGESRPAVLSVADPETIRLLGSPVRQDIVDYLSGAGPCTVPELAAGLGRPADTLYYHLRKLEAAGLITRADSRSGMVVDLPADDVRLRYSPGTSANVAAVRDAVGTMLRSAERSFGEALSGSAVRVEGPDRELWASRARGRLTEAELCEVNAAVRRIHSILRGGGDRGGERMYEVTVVLSPLPDRPADRRKA